MATDHSAPDLLHTLWFPRLRVRGAIVRLAASAAEVWRRGGYPAAVATALGEVLAASALFLSGTKSASKLSIQLQGGGGLKLLFAEASPGVALRGIARLDPAQPVQLFPPPPEARLAITIEAGSEHRYQGIVPLEGADLAAAFMGYFERSEQLPTRLKLASDGAAQAAGLIIQQVPAVGGEAAGATIDPDGWNRLGFLLDTVSTVELVQTPSLDLLRRVFAEEELVLVDSRPVHFACSCSRPRVAQVLTSLGPEECEAALVAGGDAAITITCEFCGQQYRFDRIEVLSLFRHDVQEGPARPT